MLLQSSPLLNSVVEWNLRVVVCHSFAVKRPDRTSALAQVKKTAARVLCIFTLSTYEQDSKAILAQEAWLRDELVSHTTGCSFCLEPKFADKRAAMAHAQNCQVLFQLMMLTVLREKEVGLPVGLSLTTVLLPGGQTVQLQASPDSLSLTPSNASI